MAERIIHPERHGKQHEALTSKEHHKHAEKQRHHAAEQAKKERSQVNLEKLRKAAEEAAKPKEAHHKKQEQAHDSHNTVIGTQKALKSQAYAQTLQRVQRHLPKTSRVFSKMVHNKTVDAISNVGAQTIARPSGLLGGSICAFIGSLALLYSAKHYGFRYNYLVFALLFVGGFFVGGLLELLVWAFYSRRRRF